MLLKVKDFATERCVSESIIYRHIRNHREELGENVFKKGKSTYITEEGQAFIRSLMFDQPAGDVIDSTLTQKIEKLEAELKEKQNYITAMEAGNIHKQNLINQLEQVKIPELKKEVKNLGDQLKLIEENKQKAIEDAVKAAEDALREKLSDEHQKEIENMTVAHEQAMTAERSRRLGWADIKRFFKGESNEKTREDDRSGME